MTYYKTYPELPDLDTLLQMRRTHTFKELGAMFGIPPSTLKNRLAKAEALMRETKRLGWAAWEAKGRE
jgi:DNA-directed RNA polymerase specialized sigma24 family protein